MSRINQTFAMVAQQFPKRKLFLDGWHFIPNDVDYSLSEATIIDASTQDIGGESSDRAIFAFVDDEPTVYFSEIGLTPLKPLPMSRTVIQARKLQGIQEFDEDLDSTKHYHSGF